MIPIIRILFLFAFSLYWGGLTFYTGFVVRISHDVLNDPMDGGLITQRVTAMLQVFGAVTVALMACNCLLISRHSRKYGIALFASTALLGCTLIGLFMVHGHLDAIIDLELSQITDRDAFVTSHRRYNQLTTIQWLACLAYLPITVFAWRSSDSQCGPRLDSASTA